MTCVPKQAMSVQTYRKQKKSLSYWGDKKIIKMKSRTKVKIPGVKRKPGLGLLMYNCATIFVFMFPVVVCACHVIC